MVQVVRTKISPHPYRQGHRPGNCCILTCWSCKQSYNQTSNTNGPHTLGTKHNVSAGHFKNKVQSHLRANSKWSTDKRGLEHTHWKMQQKDKFILINKKKSISLVFKIISIFMDDWKILCVCNKTFSKSKGTEGAGVNDTAKGARSG